MNFWIRNIILGLFLSTLAWAFFANQELLLSLDGSLGSSDEDSQEISKVIDEGKNTKASATTGKPSQYQQGRKTTNAAALGLSKFYANLHGDMDEKGPKIRNNIVYLPEPQGDLSKLLQAREMVVRPYKKTWQGTIQSRPFRTGETLNQKLYEYTDTDGVALFWWLNRDYVVKDPFRIEKNILKTAFQVAKAVEGHFPSGLSIYFCHRQRAVVVIETAPNAYLDEECQLIENENAY